MASYKVLIPMADYGHDPTEVAVPYSVFQEASFIVEFATETGKPPECDKKMLEGVTGAMLGADANAKAAHSELVSTKENTYGSIRQPLSWSDPDFSVDSYDMIFLPGGHEKGVRQVIESKVIHEQLKSFFPKTLRTASDKKVVAAICHGVQILAFTPDSSSKVQEFPAEYTNLKEAGFKSIIHECETTGLPGYMESSIWQATRLLLGDYYKTYGTNSPNVEDFIVAGLDDPTQFKPGPTWYSGKATSPFIVEDQKYRYVSGRFPPDADTLARRAVEMVKEVHQ